MRDGRPYDTWGLGVIRNAALIEAFAIQQTFESQWTRYVVSETKRAEGQNLLDPLEEGCDELHA